MRYIGFAIAALALGGCSPTAAVVKQAAFDFSCPADQVTVQEMGPGMGWRTFGAKGCNKHASYVAGCGMFGCTVLANGANR